jgi:hypothetical protein
MCQDDKDVLSVFHANRVKCLIVGGYAVIFHAQPRFTQALDTFVKPDVANGREDLIASKLGSGRVRDLADVEEIPKAGERQAPSQDRNPH